MELYASPFSQIALRRDKNLLLFSWLKDSKTLAVEETKKEILKILDYIDRHSIQNIIVDLSEYHFSENREIRSWINYKFMPMIMNSPVQHYGFVMRSMTKEYEDIDNDDDDNLRVAYFPNLNDALTWIDTQKNKVI